MSKEKIPPVELKELFEKAGVKRDVRKDNRQQKLFHLSKEINKKGGIVMPTEEEFIVMKQKNEADFTPKDILNGKELYKSVHVKNINKETILKTFVFSLFSRADLLQKNEIIYNALIKQGFENLDKACQNPALLTKIVNNARYPNESNRDYVSFLNWFHRLEPNFCEELIEDVNQGRKREFEIRNKIAKKVPGISLKIASLFLNRFDYGNVVPVDINVQNFLARHEIKGVAVTDYKTVSGFYESDYLKAEKIVGLMAKDLGLRPAEFQCVIWDKYSLSSRLERKKINNHPQLFQ